MSLSHSSVMEDTARPSGTLWHIYHTARRSIPPHSYSHNQHCETLISIFHMQECTAFQNAKEHHWDYKQYLNYVRFEVLGAVVVKRSVFRDITPCSPLKFNRRFGGTCHLLLQSRRLSQDFQRTTRLYIPEYRTLQYLNYLAGVWTWALTSKQVYK
jgi:hypothetical protein